MSQKYINPVNEHFIYNDETRKSKCKQCHFNMAGRHSENLMRHLKRKHPIIYEDVMHQKQLRRDRLAINQCQGSQMSRKRSASKFTTEPQELFVKLDPTNIVTTTDSTDEEVDDDDDTYNAADRDAGNDVFNDNIATSSQPSSELFGKVFMEKSEMQDPNDNDGNHIKNEQNRDIPNDIYRHSYYNQSTAIQVSTKQIEQQANTTTHASSPEHLSLSLTGTGDDTFYLQYLGNKFSKYSTRTKNIVQFQINRILYKADMGGFDNIELFNPYQKD